MWKGSIFFRFLISYITVMLIPISISFVSYNNTVGIMEREAQEASLSTLDQCMIALDTRFAEVDRIATQISVNPKVLSFGLESSPYVNPKLPWKINDLQQEIAPLTFGNDFIEMLCVYFGNSKVIISDTQSFISSSKFYDVFLKYGEMSDIEWENNILSGKYSNEYFPQTFVRLGFIENKAERLEEQMLMYIKTFPSSTAHKCQVIIFIPNSNISDLFRSITVDQEGLAYIMDSQGDVLFTTSALEHSVNLKHIDLSGTNGSIIRNIEGQKMIVNYKTSLYNGWKYVTVIPYNIVMEKVYYVKQIIIILLVTSMLLGLVGAFFMAYRNCKPIQSIIGILQRLKEGSKSIDLKQNEYVYLRKSILNLISDNRIMQENFKKQLPLLKTIFIDKLLSGNFSNYNEIEWFLDQLGLIRFNGSIVVAISRIDLANSNFMEMGAIKLIMKDTVEKYLGTNVYYHDLDFDKQIIIFNINDTNDINKNKYVEEVLNNVCKDLYETHNVSISFVLGSLVEDYMDISRSFDEAKETLDYKMLRKNNSILWYSQILKDQDSYFYPMNVESRLINFAKLGDRKEIDRILKQIYKENFVKRNLSSNMMTQLIFELKGTFFKVIDILSVEDKENIKQVVENINTFDNCKSIDEMFTLILEIFDKICILSKGNKNSTNYDIINDIVEYINFNYQNPQLSLVELADKFSFAPAYLSQFFKEKTKKNFSIYLEQIRIKNACILLSKGMAINQVAQKVGYNSAYVFRQAFKRNMGMLPSEYKNRTEQKEYIF